MEISVQYQKKISFHLEEIQRSARPVVIFGAGRAGWYIMKVLEHYKVPIVAFSANVVGGGDKYFNYPVLPPEDIALQFPDAYILLGVFRPETGRSLIVMFQQLNFKQVYHDTDAFLYKYFINVAGRKCDNEVFARSIQILFENYQEGVDKYGMTSGGHYVSPFVTGVITQRCTLRCRDCAQFIPYYESPKNYSTSSVVEDLRQYAKAFDLIPEISLHGGEPFLHPNVAEICEEISKIPNIVFVSFVTNGTLLPSEETLLRISACGADVHQSGGYGSLSRKQGELSEALHRNNIYSDILFCSPSETWNQYPPLVKHYRPDVANNELYRRCVSSKICCQLMEGQLYRCAISMHGVHQGKIPQTEGDYVNLHASSDEVLIGQIRSYLDRNSALGACDYCDPFSGAEVLPAVQLPRKSSVN